MTRAVRKPAKPQHRCEARTRDGRPCRAVPMVNKRGGRYLCLFHFSNNAAACGAKGGRHRADMDVNCLTQFDPPTKPEDLLPILSATMTEIRAGKIDARTVQSLVSCTGAFLDVIQVADHERRLKALEAAKFGPPEIIPNPIKKEDL